ncbi:MAG: hypothetical protein HC893_01975 [Chloroflexaceae bacterium]|nr:hypothetical protein [Chloroflexaceae bacterium]
MTVASAPASAAPGAYASNATRAPLRALEAVSQRCGLQRHRLLMLLGAPGSGKSTFINYLTHCLAEAALAELEEAYACRDTWLAKLPDWEHGPLIPIRIVLRDFATSEIVAKATKGTPKLLFDFLRASLDELHLGEALLPLAQYLRNGRALLLLDGFDEVIGQTTLLHVAESVRMLVQAYQHSPVVVSVSYS